tara:strand:- start:5052 stop:5273 length:222 start_codon:yes stop_codon:yes gene_type:complete
MELNASISRTYTVTWAMSAMVPPLASTMARMFSSTCVAWARISPAPTSLPSASSATWPAIKSNGPLSVRMLLE